MITRRGLITGLATLLAAPAIVRVGSLMPVKAWTDGVALQSATHPVGPLISREILACDINAESVIVRETWNARHPECPFTIYPAGMTDYLRERTVSIRKDAIMSRFEAALMFGNV